MRLAESKGFQQFTGAIRISSANPSQFFSEHTRARDREMGAIDIPPEPAWVKDKRPAWLSWEYLVREFLDNLASHTDNECQEWKGTCTKGFPMLRIEPSRTKRWIMSARKLSVAINGIAFNPHRVSSCCGNIRCVNARHLIVKAIVAGSCQDEYTTIKTYLDSRTELISGSGCKIWRGQIRHGVPWAAFSFNGKMLFNNPTRQVVLSLTGRRVGRHAKVVKTKCDNPMCIEASHIIIPPQLADSDEELSSLSDFYTEGRIRAMKRARIVREKGLDRDEVIMSSGRIKKVGGQYKKCKWCGRRFYVFNSDASHSVSCRDCLRSGRCGLHKLSDEDVRNIISLKKAGITYSELSDMYRVGKRLIVEIVMRRGYRFVAL